MFGIPGEQPRLLPGVVAALLTLALDQASKLWLLFVFDIAHRGTVRLTSFFDLVLLLNTGISYGWFQTESAIGQAILLAVKAIAVVALAIWMARSRTLIATVAILVFAVWGQISSSPVYRGRLGVTETVTTRKEIQRTTLKLIRQKPVFGWGYNTFDKAKLTVPSRDPRYDELIKRVGFPK